VKRREFIAGLGGAAAWPVGARAQQSAKPVVGFLSSLSLAETDHLVAAFRQGLGDIGFITSQNVAIEYRFAGGRYDGLPVQVAELLGLRVAAIAAIGPPAALAAKNATTTIPIVFTSGADPVRAGLVASLNRPGGNVTGVSLFGSMLSPKRMELVLELASAGAPLALLINPNYSEAADELRDVEAAAQARGRPLVIVNASNESEFAAAFESIIRQRAGALVVGSDPFFFSRRSQLVAMAAHYKLPAIYEWRDFAVDGGLMSYGTIGTGVYRQAGVYVGKILKGERPADLPVSQPTKFEFVLNLKTAKALGLSVPSSLLVAADEVIE